MKKYLLALCLFLPFVANSTTNCPEAKVQHLQIERDSILVFQEGQNWHLIGPPSDPGVQAMYSALLSAQMAGKKVIIRFPAGYDCKAYNLSVPALMVRTNNF
ncbi:hypothetical protein [Pseudoalteromonas rubra]|uniref:Uncharacterized protein n=1 Tax=Pseudoalteromonas rubra TaxID=43658 RepID=A0A4Q7DZQ2_9GAMM|nr:hypothetical protein [Pseudoalteromonas rubra]RZM72708.1 hypothetical protein C3B51_21680 [Pseudoalteromonas rubra]